MSRKRIYLNGYFDHNFGDDWMMTLIVRSVPDVTFVVDETANGPVLEETNVVVTNSSECRKLPALLVTGSGFMINNPAALKAELKMFLRGQYFGDYCLGCNMEPLDSKLKEFLIRRKLERFKLITCRDGASYAWLKANTRKPEVVQLPDIVLSMPKEYLPPRKDEGLLGVSVIHRAGDAEDCAYYRNMASMIDAWVEKTGRNVLLLAFDTGTEDDLFACRSVLNLCARPDKVQIVSHKTGQEIPEAFARCERIVGARFHSMVLAVKMGIPFYPVIFREKMRNLVQDLHYPIAGANIDRMDLEQIKAFVFGEPATYQLDAQIVIDAEKHAQLLRKTLYGG